MHDYISYVLVIHVYFSMQQSIVQTAKVSLKSGKMTPPIRITRDSHAIANGNTMTITECRVYKCNSFVCSVLADKS